MKILKLLLATVLVSMIDSQGCCLRSSSTFYIIGPQNQKIGKIRLAPELTRQIMREKILESFAENIAHSVGDPRVYIKHGDVTCLDLNSDLQLTLTKAQINYLNKNAKQLKTEIVILCDVS
mgnify:FL=1